MPLRNIALLFALMAAASVGSAATIYSNFGSGQNSYSEWAGVTVYHDDDAYSSIAQSFVPAANYYLSSIELVITDRIPSYNETLTVSLFNDNGGQPGGSAIEIFTLTGALAQFGSAAPTLQFDSKVNPLLQAGSKYWISITGSGGSHLVWNQNVTGAQGYAFKDDDEWDLSRMGTQGAMEVDGASTRMAAAVEQSYSSTGGGASPEPGPIWLALSGLGLIAISRRASPTR